MKTSESYISKVCSFEMNHMEISVGITAAAFGGRDEKARRTVNNRENIRKLLTRFEGFNQVIIAAARKGEYEGLGAHVVIDQNDGIGPIEGLRRILEEAESEYVFVCASDMPMISGDLVKYMSGFICSDYDCYCIVDEDHIHPLCAIYSVEVLPLIEKAVSEGDFKLIHLLQRCRTKYISLEFTCFEKKLLKNLQVREAAEDLKPAVVFCVSGSKNTGKTGLVVRLINEFISEGYSVGAIKHDGHDYIMDYPDTDTGRFSAAGAERSLIFSRNRYSINGVGKAEPYDMLQLCRGLDVVIIEGLKDSSFPKVYMVSEERQSASDLICIVTEKKSPIKICDCPVFHRDDTEGIFSCIKKYFKMEQSV